MRDRPCGVCGDEGVRVILYTARRGPLAGQPMCKDCLMNAGGPWLLHPPEQDHVVQATLEEQ